MPRGGKRPGAGLKHGFKYPKTLEKERVLAACRELIMQKAEEMVAAQIEHSKGVPYLMLRREDGTYARATDKKQVEAWVDSGGTLGQIFTQSPNVQAFSTLMDRTFGKPSETHEVTLKGEVDVILSRLTAGRKRAHGKEEI